MEPQAPSLIKEIKRRFGVTQTDLSALLGITQPAVSEYEAGNVVKERYDIIKTLQDVLAGKINVPKIVEHSAQELNIAETEKEIRRYVTTQARQAARETPEPGSRRNKKKGARPIQESRTTKHSGQD